MIKINLASRKSATLMDAGATSAGGRTRIAGLKNLTYQDIKDIPNLRQLIVLGIVAYLGGFFLDDIKGEEIKKADASIQKLKTEQDGLKKELESSKKYEGIKKALESDEVVIRTKLETIQKLVTDRATPPKVLVSLSSAIPKEVWLSQIRVADSKISLSGDALDFNQVSEFMKNLNESAFFKDVALLNTQQGKDEAGLDTAKFELAMKRR